MWGWELQKSVLNKYNAHPFRLVKAVLLSEFILTFVISAQFLLNACVIKYMQKDCFVQCDSVNISELGPCLCIVMLVNNWMFHGYEIFHN